MTKIKMCGIRRMCDIEYANEVRPDYIGFVFAPKSRRYIAPDEALTLRKALAHGIIPVGVFVDEKPEIVADIVNSGAIEMVQLHGSEDENYIASLRKLTNAPIIKAFIVRSAADTAAANASSAEYVLLDSGKGSGKVFDHELLSGMEREYFLAGGLDTENVADAVRTLHPFAVDASSSLETDGVKDLEKMRQFAVSVSSD